MTQATEDQPTTSLEQPTPAVEEPTQSVEPPTTLIDQSAKPVDETAKAVDQPAKPVEPPTKSVPENVTQEAIQTLFDFEPEQLLRPPAAIEMFVRRIVRGANYYEGPEQRTERRYAVSLPVAAVPVDASMKKAGEVFMAFTRDISSGGIAMYHTRRVSDKFLAVEIKANAGDKMRVLVEVLRCSPVGLFYEIAGRFVSRLND